MSSSSERKRRLRSHHKALRNQEAASHIAHTVTLTRMKVIENIAPQKYCDADFTMSQPKHEVAWKHTQATMFPPTTKSRDKTSAFITDQTRHSAQVKKTRSGKHKVRVKEIVERPDPRVIKHELEKHAKRFEKNEDKRAHFNRFRTIVYTDDRKHNDYLGPEGAFTMSKRNKITMKKQKRFGRWVRNPLEPKEKDVIVTHPKIEKRSD